MNVICEFMCFFLVMYLFWGLPVVLGSLLAVTSVFGEGLKGKGAVRRAEAGLLEAEEVCEALRSTQATKDAILRSIAGICSGRRAAVYCVLRSDPLIARDEPIRSSSYYRRLG